MKSTFSRLFTALALLLLTTLLLMGVVFQWLANRYLTTQAVTALEADANIITSLTQAGYDSEELTSEEFHLAMSVAVTVSDADAVLCDAQGKLLMCAKAPMGCEHVGMRLDKDYVQRILSTGGFTDSGVIGGLYQEERYMVSSLVKDSQTGTPRAIILVSSPVDITLSTMRRISETFIVVAILAVLLCVVLLMFFVRRESHPLKDMAKAARAFGHGDLDARVTVSGHHSQEVKELALAFNNMATSLEKSEYQRREFVANVSHELKTPMTTISGYVDGILDGTIPPERSRKYLSLVSDETKRLSRLVRSMLDISRLQNEETMPEEQKSRFDLTEMTGQVLISFEGKINEKNIDVQVTMPEHPVYTLANPDAINQVIYNLTDNGVKFCPPGGTLSVTVREGKQKLYVSVANQGEVIPAEELPLVFERFHKIDKSRSQNRDGWGLGLYIVKTIINSHGENISVTSADGETKFTFTLPKVL
ncbi:MAG: HAMP domain-containing histidine kinase [Ruminococcaceae bacterium]|nr:HAMP domain-containing histidine kinase [Oscillospiraceae bacterium]